VKQTEFSDECADATLPVITPCDCVIAFGIPVSREDLLRNRERGFARQLDGEDRIDEFIRKYEATIAVVRRSGAHVITELTINSLAQLFNRERYVVVILFSHMEGDRLELKDEFVEISRIVEQVPVGFKGTIDVSTCHSRELFRALKQNRPECLPIYSDAEILHAQAWLVFYRALFEYLHIRPMQYQRAYVEVVHEFLRKAREELAKVTKLEELLKLYLDRIGRYREHLGSERPVTREDNEFLIQLLSRRMSRNDYLIIVALVLIFIAFGLAVVVVWNNRGDATKLATAFGTLLLFTLAVARLLRRFWLDKSVMDILMVALHELPPQEAAALVNVLYWRIVKGLMRRW
jgi:hypothetical protein